MSEEKFDIIIKELHGMKTSQQELRQEFREMKEDQQGLRQEFREMKEDQQGLRQEFREMKEDQQGLRQDFQEMKATQKSMQKEQAQMHHRFDVVETKVDQAQQDITTIKDSIARIDQSVHEDVVAILQTIQKSERDNKAEIAVLNDRLFRVESTVEKFIK